MIRFVLFCRKIIALRKSPLVALGDLFEVSGEERFIVALYGLVLLSILKRIVHDLFTLLGTAAELVLVVRVICRSNARLGFSMQWVRCKLVPVRCNLVRRDFTWNVWCTRAELEYPFKNVLCDALSRVLDNSFGYLLLVSLIMLPARA